jgi:hypothetical protein
MNSRIEKVHLIVGLTTVILFSGTGVYLRLHQPPMTQIELGPRILLRSGHIYFLFSGLLNVIAGLRGDSHRSGKLSLIGSILLLMAPILFVIGFFVESTTPNLDRPVTASGIFVAFGGVFLHFLEFTRVRTVRKRTTGS